MDGWWFPEEESWEEEFPFIFLLKVEIPPPFVGVGHPRLSTIALTASLNVPAH